MHAVPRPLRKERQYELKSYVGAAVEKIMMHVCCAAKTMEYHHGWALLSTAMLCVPPEETASMLHRQQAETFPTERLPLVAVPPSGGARPLYAVGEGGLGAWLAALDGPTREWVQGNGFRAERHRVLVLPAADGGIGGAVLGLGPTAAANAISPWWFAGLTEKLPNGTYVLSTPLPLLAREACALGFALGRYRFERYRKATGAQREVHLVWPEGVDQDRTRRFVMADALARDLVNTPAEDLCPAALAAVVAGIARDHGATFRQWVGDELLTENCHAIHAVGRAAVVAPRLAELRWGSAGPLVTLVGKGVCFDTGGLDLKTTSGMALMKKDMGGAAMALALASLVMGAGLPLRLRVLLPLVENAIGSKAFRPGDVLHTRKGLTVEVTNTDAEGRLVLADALALADEERPDLLIDLATLTGAARVALGPDLPAVFASDRQLAAAAVAAGEAMHDPLWELPLWHGYDDELASRVADLANTSASGFAGAILGALFLQRFVASTTPWLHVDLYAWNPRDRPGRPAGGDAQAVRALFHLLEQRFGAQ